MNFFDELDKLKPLLDFAQTLRGHEAKADAIISATTAASAKIGTDIPELSADFANILQAAQEMKASALSAKAQIVALIGPALDAVKASAATTPATSAAPIGE